MENVYLGDERTGINNSGTEERGDVHYDTLNPQLFMSQDLSIKPDIFPSQNISPQNSPSQNYPSQNHPFQNQVS